jgi:probable biosynthetic protein (TIGR04098 family)
MRETVVHLPQTDATGLSENWLFKHCGEMHWDHLCAALGVGGVNAEEMRDDAGRRLYPTFVAIRGRYESPLCSVQMDEHLRTSVKVCHFGRAFFHGIVTLDNAAARFELEMLTTFVARNREGLNDLHQSLPASKLVYRGEPAPAPPGILKLSQALRHGDLTDYDILGHRFALNGPGMALSASYEPSPYTDYNGAGLLYFAAYPAISDTLERQLIIRHRLLDGVGGLSEKGGDWAVLTSTVARDVFYYRNLDLGQRLTATLKRFDHVGRNIILHTSLAAEPDGATLADIFTAKRLIL